MKFNLYLLSVLFFLSIQILSCDNNKAEMISKIEQLSKKINVSLNVFGEIKAEKQLAIELVFLKPYVSNDRQQELFISYLVYKIQEFTNYEKINFYYYLSHEKDIKVLEVEYDKKKIRDLKLKYDQGNLFHAIEFCLREFKETDIYAFNNLIKFLGKKTNGVIIDKPFFDVLFHYHEEIEAGNYEGKAKNTLLLIYVMAKDGFREDDRFKNVPELLLEIWKLFSPEDILDYKVKFEKNAKK